MEVVASHVNELTDHNARLFLTDHVCLRLRRLPTPSHPRRTLILACIIYWQTREISRIAAAPDFPFDPELIARVSPIEWKNVILYGEIKIDPDKLRIRGR